MTRTLLFLLGIVLVAVSGFFAGTFGFGMAPTWVSVLAVLLLALPSLAACFRLFGWKRGLAIFGGLGVFALIVESIGVVTGYPYGVFQYSGELGWKVFGLVPWTVPFAWTPLLFAAVATVLYFWPARDSTGSIIRRSFVAAIILVALDAVLDPGAVVAGLWTYAQPGRYYGVPWTNFAGWLLSGYIGSFFFYQMLPKAQARLPLGFLVSGSLSLSFWTGVVVAEGLKIPALAGITFTIFLFVMYAREAYISKTHAR